MSETDEQRELRWLCEAVADASEDTGENFTPIDNRQTAKIIERLQENTELRAWKKFVKDSVGTVIGDDKLAELIMTAADNTTNLEGPA